MDRFFESKMFVRIISVILAITLWLYVVSETGRPLGPTQETDRPFEEIQVEFINIADNLKVVGPPLTVNVLVMGDGSVVRGLTRADITAVVDLAGLDAGHHELPIQVRAPETVRVTSVEPEVAVLTLASTVVRRIALKVVVEGFPAPGRTVGDPKPETDFVQVRGTAYEVSQVAEAVVVVTLNGESDTIRRILPVEITNMSGSELKGLSVTPEVVEIIVPISPAPEDLSTGEGDGEVSQVPAGE